MNESLAISISDLYDITGREIKLRVGLVSILLNPFYCIESEILSEYLDKYGTFIEKAREVIHAGSIKIDSLIKQYLTNRGIYLPEEDLFVIRHDYVQCYGMYYFGKHFNSNMSKITSKSKELGDFKVSNSLTSDPTFIYKIVGDAQECMHAIEQMLKEWGSSTSIMNTFVKGELNCNNYNAHRLWYYEEPSPQVSTASRKQKFGNRWLKIGEDSKPYEG